MHNKGSSRALAISYPGSVRIIHWLRGTLQGIGLSLALIRHLGTPGRDFWVCGLGLVSLENKFFTNHGKCPRENRNDSIRWRDSYFVLPQLQWFIYCNILGICGSSWWSAWWLGKNGWKQIVLIRKWAYLAMSRKHLPSVEGLELEL